MAGIDEKGSIIHLNVKAVNNIHSDTNAPEAPANLAAVAVSDARLDLGW